MKTIGKVKVTQAQVNTIDWLVGNSQRNFAESDFNKVHKLFDWEVKECYKDVVVLILRSRAIEDMGLLFLADSTRMIWIGKRGGIQKATCTTNDLISDHKATQHAKMGITLVS